LINTAFHMVESLIPDAGDIVVVATTNPDGIATYVLQIHPRVDRFLMATREQAVSNALSYAALRRVQAWLLETGQDFVLLEGVRQVGAQT